MEIVFAKSEAEYFEWDNFVINNPKGNHLALSGWLNSFKSYGFEHEIFYTKENDQIVAGSAAVIAKFSIFKFYIIPYGPICDTNSENTIHELIEIAKKSAVEKSCCYFEFTLPKSDSDQLKGYAYPNSLDFAKKFKSGKLFKYVYAASGVNFIDLKGYNVETAEVLLMNFSVRTRRDIRIGIKNIDKIAFAENLDEIQEAYNLCILNAKQANYSVREWESIKETLERLVNSNEGIFLMAYKENVLVGSVFLIKGGRHLTYVFGGTRKEFSNIYPGYALQWEAIKISLKLQYEWYNISLGGSEGVKKFKGKFNTESINYTNPHFHLILQPLRFKIFITFEKHLKKYKATIAKWLSSIK